jgi:hypothetical protein
MLVLFCNKNGDKGDNMFSYANPFQLGSVTTAFWTYLERNLRAQLESDLQMDLLASAGNGTVSDDRVLARINHLSQAARAFFDGNPSIVMLSGNPVLKPMVQAMLREFVRCYQRTEHETKKGLGIPLREWRRPGSWGDEMAALAVSDPAHQAMVLQAAVLPSPSRQEVCQQLSGELIKKHAAHQAQMS